MDNWYRGVAASPQDDQGRIMVRIPALSGNNTVGPAFPFDIRDPVDPGEGVWVFFEQGDLARPVWAGRWGRNE